LYCTQLFTNSIIVSLFIHCLPVNVLRLTSSLLKLIINSWFEVIMHCLLYFRHFSYICLNCVWQNQSRPLQLVTNRQPITCRACNTSPKLALRTVVTTSHVTWIRCVLFLFFVVWLSLPVQSIAWIGSSLKWPVVSSGMLNPTNSSHLNCCSHRLRQFFSSRAVFCTFLLRAASFGNVDF